MIRSTGNEPTIRKSVTIPDGIVLEMDGFSYGLFTNRADMMMFSVRDFTLFLRGLSIDIAKECDRIYNNKKKSEEMYEAEFTRLQSDLMTFLDDYNLSSTTMFTLYITQAHYNIIETLIGDDKPFRNIQDYCRVAIVWEIRRIRDLPVFVDEYMIDDTDNPYDDSHYVE